MQLHEQFVQPPSEHTISTIKKRATALNKKVNQPSEARIKTNFIMW